MTCITPWKKSSCILFADDTTAYLSGDKKEELFTSLKLDLLELIEWFCCNKLSLNLAKTNFIIFSPKGIKEYNLNQTFHILDINNEIIKQAKSAKFLGIDLDKYLDWNIHVSKIMSKLSRGLYILNKVKNVLPQSAMKTLYYSIFHSHLTYGIMIWGSSLSTSLK